MNMKQLQYVIALSKTLSFSQVADRLGISQPALSKQIQNLENELGIKLFDRKHNPLALTPAGEYFVRNAKELLFMEEQMRKGLDRFQSGEYGRLTIGATPFRSFYLMPELVKKIRTRFPGIQVILREVSSAQLRKEAAEGKYDLAVVNLPVDTTLLNVIPLKPDVLVLAVHNSMVGLMPQFSEGESLEVDFSQVKDLSFVTLSSGQELRQLFDGLCTAAGFYPNIAAEVNSITTAWAMARAGVGATLLPLQFVHSQKVDSNLSLYVIKNNLYSREPVVVTRRGQIMSPYAEYAIQALTDQI